MIRALARESGWTWALGIAVVLGLAGALVAGVVLKVPILERGIPGSWLIASTMALLVWYVLRPRWQREIAVLLRARWHRALLVLFVAVLALLATAPMLAHGIGGYELTLYPVLYATAVLGAILAGNLGWAPILVFSILAETLNNLSLRSLSFWVNTHSDSVVAFGTCLLIGLVAFYVWRGPLVGYLSADE